jgi:crotonobetainyl-CoA:carnitine CoA-transferase CaiB-like acyl-CoA transferase
LDYGVEHRLYQCYNAEAAGHRPSKQLDASSARRVCGRFGPSAPYSRSFSSEIEQRALRSEGWEMSDRTDVSGDGATGGFQHFLGGLRVLEIGNELGEYCGKVLAGLGADVVRVERPGGDETRTYGPFYKDEPHPDRSLYFWHYNLGKRSVVLDLDRESDLHELTRLIETVDVVVDSRPRSYLSHYGLDFESLRVANPGLIWARISPFGDDGPWADYQASDLVQLALGGIMDNCGYDPDPRGVYDTPPIAPQMWQSYQLAGELTVISILGALHYRLSTGEGQRLSTSVHEVVSSNTENDTPNWIYLAQKHRRQTCRNSMPFNSDLPSIALTKDGRWLLPYRTYAGTGGSVVVDGNSGTAQLLRDYGMQAEIDDPNATVTPERLTELTDKLISRLLYDRDLWREGQNYGMPWAPIRKPEENIDDEHWRMRDAFFEVRHDELDESFVYTGAKWVTEGLEWRRGPRPPLVGEHTVEVLEEWAKPAAPHVRAHVSDRATQSALVSKRGKPFALSDIRVIDLSWMLASAGAGRYLSALGAEVIKVEHESRFDGLRVANVALCPPGGREEREAATGPIDLPEVTSPNRTGFFMEINSGKLGMSLNLKHPEGRKVLEDLIRDADMIVEGFSPGTMIRLGLGYEQLKALNPSIIYVQQSGLGELGTYGRARTYWPTAQALSGISDMSGLPEPFPPAGIGYSYLDWFGAYNMAQAMMAALYRRDVTGEGCHIDASQGGTGVYLTGTSILDYSVNGRKWSRYGNRSPYKPAAPSAAFRTQGEDSWIAISAFTEEQWRSLVGILGLDSLAGDERFATLAQRLAHQDELEAAIGSATLRWNGFELMEELQRNHIPAGVCQTAQQRVEEDPQLKHLGWLTELNQSEIGRWPVREYPVKFSETPAYIGGRLDRSGPNYAEDNEYVLRDILGKSPEEIQAMRDSGAL